MRRKLRLIRENFIKLTALIVLGLALAWVYSKRSLTVDYIAPEIFRLALLLAIGLYLIYLVSVIQSISHSGWLRRFDPGDPDSLAQLEAMKRYKLPAKLAEVVQKRDDDLMESIHLYLKSRGFNEQVRRGFGLIYERKLFGFDLRLKPRWQRVIILYRPILNVIVIDQMFKEVIDYIERGVPYAKYNQYILITDMENDQEVLSAAAGAVNFLGKLDKSYLSPILIDQHLGRIFFPLDRSLVSLRQKIFHDFLRYDLLWFLSRRKAKKQGQVVSPKLPPGGKKQVLVKQPKMKDHIRSRQGLPPRVRTGQTSTRNQRRTNPTRRPVERKLKDSPGSDELR